VDATADASGAIRRRYLNGRGDLHPGAGTPGDDWAAGAFIAPSWWTKPVDAGRPGDRSVKAISDEQLAAGQPYLFDTWRYPIAWARMRAAWLRRRIDAQPRPGRRLHLCFEAVGPRATLLVNGREAGSHLHPALPFEVDATHLLRPGDNEIALRIEDFHRDHLNRPTVPTGNALLIDAGSGRTAG
jgi:hypothetical protein